MRVPIWAAAIIGLALWAIVFVVLGVWQQPRAETWVSFGGISHHYSDKPYNENNRGLGIEYDLSRDWRVLAGTYKNSYNLDTYYGGFGYTPLHIGPVSLGMVAGLFSGYAEKWTPVAMGAAFIEGKRYGLNIMYLPKYGDFDGLLALSFKVKF